MDKRLRIESRTTTRSVQTEVRIYVYGCRREIPRTWKPRSREIVPRRPRSTIFSLQSDPVIRITVGAYGVKGLRTRKVGHSVSSLRLHTIDEKKKKIRDTNSVISFLFLRGNNNPHIVHTETPEP